MRLPLIHLASLLLGCGLGQAQPTHLGDLLHPTRQTDPDFGIDPSIVRGRAVDVDFSLLDAVRPGETLRLELFPGESVYALFETKEELWGRADKYTWKGRLVGLSESRFSMTRIEDTLAATIQRSAAVQTHLLIVPKLGRICVREMRGKDRKRCGTCMSHEETGTQGLLGGPPPTANAGSGGVLNCDDDDPSQIKLLAVYDLSTISRVGSAPAVEATIQQAINDANDAFQTAAGVTLVVTRMAVTSFNASSSTTCDFALDSLTSTNDGIMDEVHQWRVEDEADLVTFVFGNHAGEGSSGSIQVGLAWRPSVAAHYHSGSGFSVSVYDYLSGPDWVLAHEIGHNFGCGHDDSNASGTHIAPYAHGYFYEESRLPQHNDRSYKTLMSYESSYPCSSGFCEKWSVNAFSSPNGYVNGLPMGDANHYNARVIQEWRQAVANYSHGVLGHNDPPTITAHPQATTICAGYYASPITAMTMDADNVATFQWYKDSVAIPGQTTNQLRFRGVVDASFAGSYHCIVTSCSTRSGDRRATQFATLTIDTTCRPTRIDNPSTTALTSVAPSDFNLTELGDVNGDGYQDFVFGHPKDSTSSRTERGALYVYSGATLERMYATVGNVSFAHLGRSFASADLNDDGYDELIVGVPGENKIEIHRGHATGLTTWYSLNGPATGYGQHLSSARLPDAGGQGFFASDLANHLFMVSGFGGPDWTVDVGYDIRGLCTVGDIDGDGRDDVAVGLFQATQSLQLRSGRDGSVIWSRTGLNLAVPAIVALGDVDGDTIPDFAVAPSGANTHLISGASGATLRQFLVATAHLSGSGGDLDGDGLEDLIVGLTSSYNRANVYSTSTGTLLDSVLNCNGETILGMDLDGDSRGEKVYHVVTNGVRSDHFAIADSPSVGTGPGLFIPYGTRCSDSASRLATVDIADVVLPRIDRTTNLQLYGLPQNTQAYVSVGFSRLRFDLSGLGIPCNMYTEFNPILSAATGSGRATLAIPIPNDVNLIGGRLMLQAFVPDLASTNALPFTLSNGGELTIGASY